MFRDFAACVLIKHDLAKNRLVQRLIVLCSQQERCLLYTSRHYDVIARVQQLDAGVAADVTSAAGDQNCHNKRDVYKRQPIR